MPGKQSQVKLPEAAVLPLEVAKKEIVEATATMCIPEDEFLMDVMHKEATNPMPQDQDQDERKEIKFIDYSEGITTYLFLAPSQL